MRLERVPVAREALQFSSSVFVNARRVLTWFMEMSSTRGYANPDGREFQFHEVQFTC